MNSTFLVRYQDVLLLTKVKDVYVEAFLVLSHQEQGNDDEDENDDELWGLHCLCNELLNIHIIWEVKTKPQLFVYICGSNEKLRKNAFIISNNKGGSWLRCCDKMLTDLL